MLSRMLLRMDQRYPTAQERLEIENYLASVPARRAAMADIRRHVLPIAEFVMAGIRQMYPQFARYHGAGYEKGQRDMVLLTQMAANAMFLGEHDTLDDMFTHWYRTILKGVHISPDFMKDTFALWHQGMEKYLAPTTYSLLSIHTRHMVEILLDLPVPASNETGERRMLART